MVNTKIRLVIFFAAKDGEALHSQQKQDRELAAAQIMNSLLPNSYLSWRKWGKTTRPFRYDLNQIPYDSTVKWEIDLRDLDLIVRVPDELWMEVADIVQETGSKTIPKKKKKKSIKQLSSFHTLGRQCSKSFKLGFSSTWIENSICTSWI